MDGVVKECNFASLNENIKFSIEYRDDTVVIKKNGVEKELPKEYLSNLDVFFRIYDYKNWEKLPKDDTKESAEYSVSVAIDDAFYRVSDDDCLPEEEQNLFFDLNKYLNACFDGTINKETLVFESFDGGGPEYTFKVLDPNYFTWYSSKEYSNPDHDKETGSGFQVKYDIYPLRMGEAVAVINGISAITEPTNDKIYVTIDEKLHLSIEHVDYSEDIEEDDIEESDEELDDYSEVELHENDFLDEDELE